MEQGSAIAEKIILLAMERGASKSICPSEIARFLFPDDWRAHMGEVVASAIELERQGKIMITQKGVPVDPVQIRGPIRLKFISIVARPE
ncbi:DUF3253 domain-containing protein [Pedobacter sp. GSP4]|uniref:DUF3253 domain-containing protein n=1 Tax=Pedobacter sp. GSP4 TaxID=3453716 RepID=UPI003EE9ECCD